MTPTILGMRSYNDFTQCKQTPHVPLQNPSQPDLNLFDQEYIEGTTQTKRKKCPRGECGEKAHYDVATMKGDILPADEFDEDKNEAPIDQEIIDLEGWKSGVGKKPEKKPSGKACEWRVSCLYNKRRQEWKITKAQLTRTCPQVEGPLEKSNVAGKGNWEQDNY
ncbi:hypothetical protein R1flu_006708 [Riccia fluitans]|uniref:Uncharacterized protein n=1 Tax=Riccia fluitans TaxID=41844 RepID=A0ABD1YZH4_9MARC